MPRTDDHAERLAVPVATAANMLSISTRTLYRLIAAGQFPQPIPIGGSKRVLISDIHNYLQRLRLKGA